MNNLDIVGRIHPTSIQVSRAAARRHEHVSALDHSHGATSLGRPSWWPRTWASTVTSVRAQLMPPIRTA